MRTRYQHLIPIVRVFACVMLAIAGLTATPLFAAGEAKTKEPSVEERVSKARFDAQVEVLQPLLTQRPAMEFKDLGDEYASAGEWEAAAIFYAIAVQKDPQLSIAYYRIAVTFANAGQKKLVLPWLKKAVEAGFWGAPALEAEDAFEPYKGAELTALTAQVKKRYAEQSAKHLGKYIVGVPEGQKAPEKGWPVMLCLHGYGDKHTSYAEVINLANSKGFGGVAISGRKPMAEDSFRWGSDPAKETHAYVQGVFEKIKKERKDLDFSRVYVMGFSEGAMQAAALVTQFPEQYGGALAVSPGGEIGIGEMAKPTMERRMFVVIGAKEHQGNKMLAQGIEEIYKDAQMPVKTYQHDGKHHFPKDWDKHFGEAFEWLKRAGGAAATQPKK